MAKKNSNVKERRIEILDFLNHFGSFGVSKIIVERLSSKYDVSTRTIYSDINFVLKKAAMPEIKKLSKRFALSFEISMRLAHRLAVSEDPIIQARGVDLINKTITSFTSFLESFGLKEITGQKIELTGGISKSSEEKLMAILDKYLK